jgi:xanthosine utilization system XapX-like protein
MKQLLMALGQGLRDHGAAAAAGTLAIPVRSVWPAVGVLIVVVGQKLCEAATPALNELLLSIAREVGPAVGKELSRRIRRWGQRRRSGRR